MELYITKQVTVFTLLMLPACFSLRSSNPRSRKNGPPVYDTTSMRFCGSTHTCETFTYDELKSRFPGVFYTESEYANTTQLTIKGTSRCKPSNNARAGSNRLCECQYGSHDGDQCCGTCRYFERAPAFIKINNRNCWVIYIPATNQYQYTPIGECSAVQGSCGDDCVQEHGYHQLLCYIFGEGFRFPFVMNRTYCSCRNSQAG